MRFSLLLFDWLNCLYFREQVGFMLIQLGLIPFKSKVQSKLGILGSWDSLVVSLLPKASFPGRPSRFSLSLRHY